MSISSSSAPMGFPRPVSTGPKDPNKDLKKPTSQTNSGYQGREMDERVRKIKEDNLRELLLQNRRLELKFDDLKTQEEKHGALRREISKLENQSQRSTTISSETVLNIQGFERDNAAKIAENENKIKIFEQEIGKTDDNLKSRNTLLTQKEYDEKEDLRRVLEIKEEIRLKTLEMKKIELEDKELQREILELKKQPDVQKVAEKRSDIAKLKKDILILTQNLELKRQSVAKAKKDFETIKQGVDEHQKLLQEKTQAAILAVNRINGIKEEIRTTQDKIKSLEANSRK